MEFLAFTNYNVEENVTRKEAEEFLGFRFTTIYGNEINDSDIKYVDLDRKTRTAEVKVGNDGVDGRTYQYRVDSYGDKEIRCRANTTNAWFTEWM